MPFKRAGMAVAAVDDRIYCWGGWAQGADLPPATGSVYDGKTGRWSALPALPGGRVLPAVTANGSQIFALGGGGDTGWLERTTFVFDTERKQWRQGPDMLSVRNGGTAAVFGKQLITAGTGLGDVTHSLETLDLSQGLTPDTSSTAVRIRYSKPDWLRR
jgi:hypothetical protein